MAIDSQTAALQPLDMDVIADYADASQPPMQAYWARVHVIAAELDPLAARYDDAIRKTNPKHQHGMMESSTVTIYITSLKNPGKGIRAGRVFLVPPILAARGIADATHHISTQAEIDGWNNEQQQRVRAAELVAASKLPPPAPIYVNLPETSVNRDNRRSNDARVGETKQ